MNEAITFKKLIEGPDGAMRVYYDVDGQADPAGHKPKPPKNPFNESFDPHRETCPMLEELDRLMRTCDVVLIPVDKASHCFDSRQELERYAKLRGFSVRFDTFQNSFICEIQFPMGRP